MHSAMTTIAKTCNALTRGFGVDGLEIPIGKVKRFTSDQAFPDDIQTLALGEETLTVCQALRHAMLDRPVRLDRDDIGWIAATMLGVLFYPPILPGASSGAGRPKGAGGLDFGTRNCRSGPFASQAA